MRSTEFSSKYLDEIECPTGTVVRLVAYSQNSTQRKQRIATFEAEYWRPIHSELMTHRVLSRNASSSRAVNKKSMREQAITNMAMPNSWGLDEPGMQANSFSLDPKTCESAWRKAATELVYIYDDLNKLGLHKQIINRFLEPVTKIKTVFTATDLENFFFLRLDADVEPNMRELAECMKTMLDRNNPEMLFNGEWHTPYVDHDWNDSGDLIYTVEGNEVSTEEALEISTSCCAQVSYRKIDNSYEKATSIYKKLNIGTEKCHASPTEHQATPMPLDVDFSVDGVTHLTKQGDYYSGNFRGWIQHRQLIPFNVHPEKNEG